MNGPIAYSSLPRPQFSTLQQKIFPPYFAVHTALPLLLALTWPGERALEAATIGIGGASLATPGGWTRSGNGWRGLYEGGEGKNFWTAVVPMGLMFGTSLLNLLVLGPATTKVMRERKHQGGFASFTTVVWGDEEDCWFFADDRGNRDERWEEVL